MQSGDSSASKQSQRQEGVEICFEHKKKAMVNGCNNDRTYQRYQEKEMKDKVAYTVLLMN